MKSPLTGAIIEPKIVPVTGVTRRRNRPGNRCYFGRIVPVTGLTLGLNFRPVVAAMRSNRRCKGSNYLTSAKTKGSPLPLACPVNILRRLLQPTNPRMKSAESGILPPPNETPRRCGNTPGHGRHLVGGDDVDEGNRSLPGRESFEIRERRFQSSETRSAERHERATMSPRRPFFARTPVVDSQALRPCARPSVSNNTRSGLRRHFGRTFSTRVRSVPLGRIR